MQLEELRTRVEWYEGRLHELEAAVEPPQQLEPTIPSYDSAASPSDTASPCALQPRPSFTAGTRPHAGAIRGDLLPGDDQSNLCDAHVQACTANSHPEPRDTDANACIEELAAQHTLKELLAPSDNEATPREQSARQNPDKGTHGKSAGAGRFDADSVDSPAQSCDNSCSTLSFEDGENTPQIIGAGHQADLHPASSKVHVPNQKHMLPQSARFSKRALRVEDQKVPEGPFTTDPHSPGSVPLGKSARATSARNRPAGAATSFGTATAAEMLPTEHTAATAAQGSDSHVDNRAGNCSTSSQRHACGAATSTAAAQTDTEAPSTGHASSRDNFAPLGFGLGPGLKSSLNSPPTLAQGGRHTDGICAVGGGAEGAAVLAGASESAPRAPLSSITNQNADSADGTAHLLPAATASASAAAEAPFPAVVDASAACARRRESARTAQSSALVRQTPTRAHGHHTRVSEEFQVSASVQVRTVQFFYIANSTLHLCLTPQ